MKFSVKIPIQYYLKLYIGKKKSVEPFQLTNKSCHISALILEPIKKDYIRPKFKIDPKFDSILEIEMSTEMAREKKFTIDPDVILRIDTVLKELFDDELFHFANRRHDMGQNIELAIAQFLHYYEIPEDVLALHTVQKRFYRRRNPPVMRKETPEERATQLNLFI